MMPTTVKLHRSKGSLSLGYSNGSVFTLSGEYLRVYSPSAEVKGHAPGQEVLQYGKKDIRVVSIEPAGNYALKLTFSDHHDSGIYTWEYLRSLCENYDQYWNDYLIRLQQAGKRREPDTQVVKLLDPNNGR